MKRLLYYLGHWETWYWFTKYLLIGPVWLWHCLRSGSFWFFTTSNPTITFGGFIGESKREVYAHLPPDSFPRSSYIDPGLPLDDVDRIVSDNNFSYPLAVKPDVGMMGFMFRRIDSRQQLLAYHNVMPVKYIVQELVTYPEEVSVFYYRYPWEDQGHITGFIKKESMFVTGDGKNTLEALIRNYPRAQFRLKELFSKHQGSLATIIPDGERYYLSYALNLSRGGRMISLAQEKDGRLLSVFDRLSHHSKKFYYGRYDIKCASIEDLKKGINFSILEYNGCGAEPHHIYGNGYTLFAACRILLQHWNILFHISRYNYDVGLPRWTFWRGLAFTLDSRRHFKKLSELDTEFSLERHSTTIPKGVHFPLFSMPLKSQLLIPLKNVV